MTSETRIPRRPLGKTGVDLSIIGMGGLVVSRTEQVFANDIVARAVERGVNYFDVAPTYGNAEERLGPALEPYRKDVFLACKTTQRDQAGAAAELDRSLQRLRTEHLDLYQVHGLTSMDELEQVLAPGGALEAFTAARQAGKVRFIGFSAHSAEVALAAMERFAFDTILFPINYVLFSQAGFGPQVQEEALRRGLGVLALKAMARTVWPATLDKQDRPARKCWYEPCAMPEEASLALRWTLSKPVTSALPPGDERYFPLAMDVAQHFKPLSAAEEQTLLAQAQGLTPIMSLASAAI